MARTITVWFSLNNKVNKQQERVDLFYIKCFKSAKEQVICSRSRTPDKESFLKYGLIVLRLTVRFLWIQQGLKLSKVSWPHYCSFLSRSKEGKKRDPGNEVALFPVRNRADFVVCFFCPREM